ncbi:MAG: sulfatase-like hydrolase/transferase [Planctomycetaceae bacterium]
MRAVRFIVVLAGLVPGFLTGTATAAENRPNVVLIMADDLGAECLSSYGCTEYATPRLDALAAEGARFTHAFAQPLCTPSRVQIMTGKYNFRNYVEFGYLPPDETTFGDLFREAGYRTSVAGKWQLAGQGRQYPEKTDPADWGFDEHCLWQLNNRAPYGDRGSRYWNPYLERNGEVVTPGDDAYGPDIVNEFVLDFITRNKDRPFVAYYPMILTHDPFEPTPGSADRDQRGEANFKDMVEHMDRLVGRLLDRLDELGLRERTLLIFTGDNGTGKKVETATTNGVIRGGKGATTDAGTHVPLIVRWPNKIEAGTVTDRLVDFTDMLPSLLAATQVAKPSNFQTDGVAFLDENGLAERQREWVYLWYEPRHSKGAARHNAVFARDHRYKLYSDGRFFDVSKTPLERVDDQLTGELSAEAGQVKRRLQAVIDRYAEEGGVTSPGN